MVKLISSLLLSLAASQKISDEEFEACIARGDCVGPQPAGRNTGGNAAIFLPWGASAGDNMQETCDDCVSDVSLGQPFEFYGQEYSTAYISSNGFISFESSSLFTPVNLNNGSYSNVPMFSAYWVDLNAEEGGNIYYRVVEGAGETAFLADALVEETFGVQGYSSTMNVVVTYYQVGYWSGTCGGLDVTFQNILSTDGDMSYAVFNYGNMDWCGADWPQAGFNDAGGNFEVLASSGSSSMMSVSSGSNVGITGRYAFSVGDLPPPCASRPCQNGGSCTDLEDLSGYTCACANGWSGDNCEDENLDIEVNSFGDFISKQLAGNIMAANDVMTNGCFCPSLIGGDVMHAKPTSAYDSICQANRQCSHCVQQSGLSCMSGYPYFTVANNDGTYSCDTAANDACMKAKCECDKKTIDDIAEAFVNNVAINTDACVAFPRSGGSSQSNPVQCCGVAPNFLQWRDSGNTECIIDQDDVPSIINSNTGEVLQSL